MSLKWIPIIVPVSLSLAVACGSSDSQVPGTDLGDAGDSGSSGEGAGRTGGSGSGGSAAAGRGGGNFGGGDFGGGDFGGGDFGGDSVGGGSVGGGSVGGGSVGGGNVGGGAGTSLPSDDAGQGGVPSGSAGVANDSAGAAGEAGATNQPDEPLGAHCLGCSAVSIGSPLWQLSGVALVAGTVGSTDPADFLAYLDSIVNPTHQYYAAQYLYGPGTAHAPPYADEGYTLLNAAGHTVKQNFTTAEFAAPSGVVITFNAVPNASAPLGSSPDFTSGPIIKDDLFPIKVDGDLYRNGVLYDAYFDATYDGMKEWAPPLAYDGSSHLMLWYGENSSFGPGVEPQGSYVFKFDVRDASGLGWHMEVPFTVSDAL